MFLQGLLHARHCSTHWDSDSMRKVTAGDWGHWGAWNSYLGSEAGLPNGKGAKDAEPSVESGMCSSNPQRRTNLFYFHPPSHWSCHASPFSWVKPARPLWSGSQQVFYHFPIQAMLQPEGRLPPNAWVPSMLSVPGATPVTSCTLLFNPSNNLWGR